MNSEQRQQLVERKREILSNRNVKVVEVNRLQVVSTNNDASRPNEGSKYNRMNTEQQQQTARQNDESNEERSQFSVKINSNHIQPDDHQSNQEIGREQLVNSSNQFQQQDNSKANKQEFVNNDALITNNSRVYVDNNISQIEQAELISRSQVSSSNIQQLLQENRDIIDDPNNLLQYLQPPKYIQDRNKIWNPQQKNNKSQIKIKPFENYIITPQAIENHNTFLGKLGVNIKLFWNSKQQAQGKFIEINKISYIFSRFQQNVNNRVEFENFLKLCCQSYLVERNENSDIITIDLNTEWQFVSETIIYRGGWGFNKSQGFGQKLIIHEGHEEGSIGFYWQDQLTFFGIGFILKQQYGYELQYHEARFEGTIEEAEEVGNNYEYSHNLLDYKVSTKQYHEVCEKEEGMDSLIKVKVKYNLTVSNGQHSFKMESIDFGN